MTKKLFILITLILIIQQSIFTFQLFPNEENFQNPNQISSQQNKNSFSKIHKQLPSNKNSLSFSSDTYKLDYANKSVTNQQFLQIMQETVEKSESEHIQSLILDFSKKNNFSGTFLTNINDGLTILGQITTIKNLEMNFSNNKIVSTNFQGITSLNQIESIIIRLDNNGIQSEDLNLDDLKNFKYLDTLVLNYTSNSIDSLQKFEFINNLNYLDTLNVYLAYNQLRAVAELEYLSIDDLTELKLDFQGNFIKNINFMHNIVNFSYLKTVSINFAENRILSLDQLKYLVQLSRIESLSIDFSKNQIADPELFEFGQWNFLKYLYINLSDGNQILKVSSLNQLSKCTNLQTLKLYLSSIDLSEINFFDQLTSSSLTDVTIDASHNSLYQVDFSSITRLRNVKNLKLDFSNNNIDSVDFDFDSNSSFYYIYINLDHNSLTSLSTLETVGNLSKIHEFIIYAQKNGITDINFTSGIAKSPTLTYLTLYLNNNGVTDPFPAEELSKCKNLYIMWIFLTLNGCDQNQCQEVRNYFYANGPALANFVC